MVPLKTTVITEMLRRLAWVPLVGHGFFSSKPLRIRLCTLQVSAPCCREVESLRRQGCVSRHRRWLRLSAEVQFAVTGVLSLGSRKCFLADEVCLRCRWEALARAWKLLLSYYGKYASGHQKMLRAGSYPVRSILSVYRVDLRQSGDVAVSIDVDELGSRCLRQAWHTHHLAGDGYDELRALVDDDVVDVEVETGRSTDQLGVWGERELRLGYADREVVKA